MKADSLNKRLSRIRSRIDVLSQPRWFPMGFDFDAHLDSLYYRNASMGKHPFVIPSKSVGEYYKRREYFNDSRINVLSAYEKILNNSVTNGQRWYQASSLRIGVIADEFLFKSIENTAEFHPLTPTNFQEYYGKLDLVLVTSTWRGLANEWTGASQQRSRVRKILEQELIPGFQASGTGVAFYSKEDPPNYNVFLSTAKLCDFIFTSAYEKVDDYKRDCPKAEVVDVLPFSVNYQHHNPIGSRKNRIDDVVFAGSWHNHKYDERRAAAVEIFDGVVMSGRRLRIIDRNWDLQNEKYLFPERYLPYVEPSVSHEDLLRLHRTSDIVVNLNSVVDSSTMFANRIVELQAMGCTVISNYNAGVNDLFPNIYMPESSFDAADIINSLSPQHLYENQMMGLRSVYSNHVSFDRIQEFLRSCGLSTENYKSPVVGIAGNPLFVDEFMKKQSFSGEVIRSRDTESLQNSQIDVVCELNDQYEYGQYYLEDLVNATKYVDSERIFAAPKSLDSRDHHDYSISEIPDHGGLTWLSEPGKLSETSGMAYVIDDLQVNERSRESIRVNEPSVPVLSVIVPIYNNGRHLEFKCFESLRRSSIFEQMEILLVDDGSTDSQTLEVVNRLERNYPNVRSFMHETGGSGSASRPRNVGLALARGEWVTYLDPDNEALSDGYAKLLSLASENDAHFAIGNMIRNADRRKLVNYVRILRKQLYKNELSDNTYAVTTDLLPKINFTPMSIQALVANTSWLKSLGIEQPLGAVGQDSYFFQQMLYYAKKVSLLNEPIHAYFAAVSNSTVNTLGTNFYKKYIPLEKARAAWLQEIGLLDEYKDRRMEAFTKGWYLDKLKRVRDDEKSESKNIINSLCNFYGAHEWKDPELRDFFGSLSDI